MHLSHRVTAAAAAALLLAGGLTGYSMGGSGDSSSSSGQENVGGSAGKEVKPGEPGFDNAGKPVVKGTFDSPAAPGATVDIAILSLKAKGRLATLSVQFTPHVPGAEPGRLSPYGLNGDHGLGASLIDPVNLKRYTVVEDSGGKELQSDDIYTDITGSPS